MHDRMEKWHTYDLLENNCYNLKNSMVVTMETDLGCKLRDNIHSGYSLYSETCSGHF